MTRIFDETFEGTGYVESGWSETVGSGCTLDEDADSSDVSSPSGWEDQCLKAIAASSGWYAYAEQYLTGGSGEPATWWRFEVVVTSEDLSDWEGLDIVDVWSSSWANVFGISIGQADGDLMLYADIYHDGSWHGYYSDPISLNTRYRVEVKWDAPNDEWEWRLDGVTQDSGTLTGSHATNCQVVRVGVVYNPDNVGVTVYHDLVAIDDADWIGAEVSGVTVTPDPATAVAVTEDPVVVVGGAVTVTPGASTAIAASAGPTVVIGSLTATPIYLAANAAVSIKGADGEQLAQDDEVYTWDADAATYGPQPALERLVTHEVSAGDYEPVFHTDGSVVWH